MTPFIEEAERLKKFLSYIDVVLIYLASNLGAINYAVLMVADYIIMPLLPDLFTLFPRSVVLILIVNCEL